MMMIKSRRLNSRIMSKFALRHFPLLPESVCQTRYLDSRLKGREKSPKNRDTATVSVSPNAQTTWQLARAMLRELRVASR